MLTETLAAHRVIRLGMPHLAFAGLSETWMLMECGHQHWTMLAERIQSSLEDLADAHGNPIYASFVCHRIHGSLEGLQSGNDVHLESRLHQLSSKRFYSLHSLAGIRVEMISIFLRRRKGNQNGALVSCSPDCVLSCSPNARDVGPVELEESDHRIRGGDWLRHSGFENASLEANLAEHMYRPAPATDFNGAQLLYFARYHEVADRAEWELCKARNPRSVTSEREIFYLANIDPGDRIVTRVVDWRAEPRRGFAHHMRLIRESDHRLMAEVFTRKQDGAS